MVFRNLNTVSGPNSCLAECSSSQGCLVHRHGQSRNRGGLCPSGTFEYDYQLN